MSIAKPTHPLLILPAPLGATYQTGSRLPNLTELEEFNGRLFSINIALLAELADVLCSVSFLEIGTVLETQARHRTY
jgi:hypothetical protein